MKFKVLGLKKLLDLKELATTRIWYVCNSEQVRSGYASDTIYCKISIGGTVEKGQRFQVIQHGKGKEKTFTIYSEERCRGFIAEAFKDVYTVRVHQGIVAEFTDMCARIREEKGGAVGIAEKKVIKYLTSEMIRYATMPVAAKDIFEDAGVNWQLALHGVEDNFSCQYGQGKCKGKICVRPLPDQTMSGLLLWAKNGGIEHFPDEFLGLKTIEGINIAGLPLERCVTHGKLGAMNHWSKYSYDIIMFNGYTVPLIRSMFVSKKKYKIIRNQPGIIELNQVNMKSINWWCMFVRPLIRGKPGGTGFMHGTLITRVFGTGDRKVFLFMDKELEQKYLKLPIIPLRDIFFTKNVAGPIDIANWLMGKPRELENTRRSKEENCRLMEIEKEANESDSDEGAPLLKPKYK